MAASLVIGTIHAIFTRHDRRYCIFSVTGRDEEYLYYSHLSRPLRSLIFGKDFIGRLPQLMEKEDICIECGLRLSVTGGVALDSGDCVAWQCPVREANQVLASLQERLREDGQWVELF